MDTQKIIDIGSKNAETLSNFTENFFMFEGVECHSMEGLLQSFKFEDIDKQIEVCKLVGIKAKRKGQKRNKHWKTTQTLWWKRDRYPRESIAYQKLLDRAFENLFNQSEKFRNSLKDTGNLELIHSFGHNNTKETVLTTEEFCSRLTKLRKKL